MEKLTIPYFGVSVEVTLYQHQFNSNAWEVQVPVFDNLVLGAIYYGNNIWDSRYRDELSKPHENRLGAIQSLLLDNHITASSIHAANARKNYDRIGFYVHGERARDLEQLERFLKGDVHDRSKVQWFDGKAFYDVLKQQTINHPATEAVNRAFNGG